MSTRLTTTIALCLFILVTACKKNGNPPPAPGGGGGGGTHTKKWTIKSISSPNSDGAGHTTFTTYDYNDTGLILKASFGYNIESDALGSETFIYKPDGKLDSVKVLRAPGFTFHYLSDFSFQVQPFLFNPDHDNVTTYNFNAHSAKELDGWNVYVPPASKSGFNYSSNTGISYNGTGGLMGMTGTDYYGVVQDYFTTASGNSNPNGTLIPNPCNNGTSVEQRFIYYFYGLSTLALGPNWPDGTYEGYSYSSGSKKASGRWNYSYTLDNNQNVVKIVRQYADDPPVFSHWQQAPALTLTYEEH